MQDGGGVVTGGVVTGGVVTGGVVTGGVVTGGVVTGVVTGGEEVPRGQYLVMLRHTVGCRSHSC